MQKLPESIYAHFERRQADIMNAANYHRFAIFVPVVHLEEGLHFLFEVRSPHVPQPGDVCFPGGRVDQTDRSMADAAVRELVEETGIDREDASILGELDYIVSPAGSIIHPFFGEIRSGASFSPDPGEVEELFFLPVRDLLTLEPETHKIALQVQPPDDFPYHLIPNGENYPFRGGSMEEKFYQLNGRTVWGLTARILMHTLDELRRGGQA
ncbi:NUDIX hydrolase [Alkalicoccus urumqiensis]|uniref:CoA pyrophosphatase n=1 Tax=Alkalicoccus urumqiensis TaxID=1548213 RepID=A0A2P6MFM0_ALKUR|nr:CoA pyrophosphatase [Alkalicoccus urumqiensis]PRO65040.1 CoA pyrophosphatase [Alkalicoccus urumqiensis]